MSESILIIDASPLIYKVFTTQGQLSVQNGPHQGEPTGLRYGFLRSVRSYQNKCAADKVAICFDVRGPVAKAEGVEHYKANRVFTEEKKTMYSQVPALREMLDCTKWTQLEAEGFEADDVIAALARAKAAKGDRVTIVSPDNDLCQLINDGPTSGSQGYVRVFRPASSREKTKDAMLDEAWVKSRYGVRPMHLLALRTMLGDASDNLPGLLGDSSRGAGHLRVHLRQIQVPITAEMFWNVVPACCDQTTLDLMRTEHGITTINNNLQAMTLSSSEIKVKVTKGGRNPAKLKEIFERLEFNSMMKFIPELTGTEADAAIDT